MATQTGADATKMHLKCVMGRFWTGFRVPKGSQYEQKLDSQALKNLAPILVQFRGPIWGHFWVPKGAKQSKAMQQ